MGMLLSIWGHLLMFGGSMLLIGYVYVTQLRAMSQSAEATRQNYFEPLIGTEVLERLVATRPAQANQVSERGDIAA